MLLANIPYGVHDATHDDTDLLNGKDDAHVAQSDASGPVQVAQLSWHGAHSSRAVELPPSQ